MANTIDEEKITSKDEYDHNTWNIHHLPLETLRIHHLLQEHQDRALVFRQTW